MLFNFCKLDISSQKLIKAYLGMMKRSIKRKLVKAKVTLNQTVQKILDINHTRKRLPFLDNAVHKEQALNEELKILNKIAAHQARLIRYYESSLEESGTRRYR